MGSAYTWYVPGSDGKSEVLYNNATTNPTYNLWGNDNAGYARRFGPALTRYYYLKDHLGTNRMTVQGDNITLADDFSGTLSQWSTVLGDGFSIQSGELVGAGAGSDNVMVNSSSATFGDGVISADVKDFADYQDANLVVRYQDPNNYYLVQAYGSQIIIFKKVAGTYQNKASVGISPDFNGGFFHLQATVIGGTFTVSWKGVQVLLWTDPTPWLSGKVGVRQCVGRIIHWDNFSAITYTTGTVAAYDDFYPFGQTMEGRSTVIGQPDARYKFTGKERDTETGWDYFGARYYDPRVGRWLSVDPRANKYFPSSPYVYASNNPLVAIDPDGKGVIVFQVLREATTRTSTETMGRITMSLNGRSVLNGSTVEPPWRWNAVNQPPESASRIPEGLYGASLAIHHPQDEESHQYVAFELIGVDPRSGVQLHIGNTWQDSRGCLLAGTSRRGKHAISGSTDFINAASNIALFDLIESAYTGVPSVILFNIRDSKKDWYPGSPEKLNPLPTFLNPQETDQEVPWWVRVARQKIY